MTTLKRINLDKPCELPFFQSKAACFWQALLFEWKSVYGKTLPRAGRNPKKDNSPPTKKGSRSFRWRAFVFARNNLCSANLFNRALSRRPRIKLSVCSSRKWQQSQLARDHSNKRRRRERERPILSEEAFNTGLSSEHHRQPGNLQYFNPSDGKRSRLG